jgi:hypothetical protein
MTTTTIMGLPSFSARLFNTGASKDAKRLEDFLANVLTSYRRVAPRDSTLADLSRIYSECRAEGWDGYSARPISPEAYHAAVRFILALPAVLPMPDVVPEPDGELSLEWDFGEWRALSLSIGRSGRIAYAALLGKEKRGTRSEIFDDVISPEILSTIWEVAHG